jgi:hypothetical protein
MNENGSIHRRLQRLETGHNEHVRGCKFVEHPTTVEDLNNLYDLIFYGVPLPPPRHPRDPEQERLLSEQYDRILENQIREGRSPRHRKNA